MHLIRSIVFVPVGAISAFEGWWKERLGVLQTCPGFLDREGRTGLWNSLAYPLHFLVLDAWEDRASASAAVQGAFGEFARRTPRPEGLTMVVPPEGWETLNTVTREGTSVAAGADDTHLRQIEWNVRLSAVPAFEATRAEFFPLLQRYSPAVRASVIYRSAGIAGRYRVVHRSTAALGAQAAEVRAWILTHPPADYADTPPNDELFVRAL